MRPTAPVAVLLTAALTAGCAGPGAVARADLKTRIDIQYGRVDEVEQVALESAAGKAAVLGGVVGALSSRRRLLGAAVGAVAAGATTAVLEGAHQGYAYTVRMEDGRMIKVVVDHGDIAAGQCVAVEQGRTTNVRLVSPNHCRPEHRAVVAEPEVAAQAQHHASVCDAATEAVLAAKTDAEVELAAKKARAVCGH